MNKVKRQEYLRKLNRDRVARHAIKQKEANFKKLNYTPYVPAEHKKPIEDIMRVVVANYLNDLEE